MVWTEMSEYILTMDEVDKSFAGNQVLHGVHFDLKPGEVHALMGENGAGKSTLMRILMGIIQRDTGTIVLNGEEVTFHNPKQALEHGIAMIHQELNPVLDMDISENIFLGKEKTLGKHVPLVNKHEQLRQTAELLEEVGIHINPRTHLRSLSVAQAQLVEIAKAISWNAKIIIMDEPTSAITEREVEILFTQIRRLRDAGVGIIYISHKMDEIFQISDRISVLRDGQYIGTKLAAETNSNQLISMMVGRDITEIYPKTEVPIGEVRMEVKHLSYSNRVKDVSFNVRRGEILGVAGLVGAGRSEMVESLFGFRRKSAGEILIDGKPVKLNRPSDAIRHKIALVTEERKVTGLNLIGSIQDNITIVSIRQLTRWKLLNRKNEAKAAQKYGERMKIKTPSMQQQVRALSGGNQQKVVLAKWLVGDPDIIIMDEPTRGIDVGAKRDIYLLMGELAAAGKSIIMISSEMPEVMGMSDRIIVLAEGKLTGEFRRGEFNQEAIMRCASDIGGME